jgi:formate hydrogenlyase subunit 3/multisubunit Na+/H+ antiporter MnhD subunit
VNLLVHLPALLVIAPLTGACASFVAGRRRAPHVALTVAVVNAALAVALAMRVLAEGPWRYRIGGWGAPVGIDLVADGTAALFLVLAAAVGLAVTIYASAYFRSSDPAAHGHGLFWTLWLFMWTSLNGLFLTGDVFNVYVCIELVGISAVTLVTLSGGADALRAGLRYLFASMLGAMTYLLGVALLYAAAGTLDMATLRQVLVADATAATGLAFMVAALVLKTALVPAHFWLPTAHASAPTPVSAALSALVVKGSYFVILRLLLDVAPPGYLGGVDVALGVLGSVAIVWGSVQALVQDRIKLLVAYSTVAQIGYLFLVFPLARAGGDVLTLALGGALVHVVSHGLAKAGLFLGAGSLITRFGHDRIADMAGAARALPLLTLGVSLAGVTMMGLPPSGGFAAKWLLVTAALASGQWWWAVVLVTGGLLAAAYMFRLIRILLAGADPQLQPARLPVGTEWVPLALSATAVMLVFAVPLIMRLAEAGTTLLAAGVNP